MINPLVSIIIPVYNRADLISETLDSILAQTYTNWECIIVDDGSTDATAEVVKNYVAKDTRFDFYTRPANKPKGANSCRNYGFELSKGEYVNWFDSDDLMEKNHLEIKTDTILKGNLDFVVGGSVNFNQDGINSQPYDFDKSTFEINAENYALQRIGWITDDFLGKRSILKNIKFNEQLKSGQEYNFFVRLLHLPVQGTFIDQIITHRRIHDDAITTRNGENTVNQLSKIANIKYQTAQDLVVYDSKKLIRWFLSGYMQYAFLLAEKKEPIPYFKSAFKLICKYYSFTKGGAFIMALWSSKYFKKGYRILKYARN